MSPLACLVVAVVVGGLIWLCGYSRGHEDGWKEAAESEEVENVVRARIAAKRRIE